MLDILFCVLMNVTIFICFKLFSTFKIDTFQAIVFNYVACVITGAIFLGDSAVLEDITIDEPWVLIAMGLGGVFVATFYLMAITTQKFSMTVSSISAKMSLIIPVLFSILLLDIESRSYTWFNYTGVVLALAAIFMSSYKEKKVDAKKLKGFDLLLPLFVFTLGGIIDSVINYTSYHFITERESAVFPMFVFVSAGIVGIFLLISKRRKLTLVSLGGGAVLGVVNYFSIYFLITSLSSFNNDGAIVYPLINVGIIVFAAGLSAAFFKERFSKLNQVGLVLAVLAIIFISYQEILAIL
ncbi:hypothetical protein JMN32_12905 [Fulvivirga sp. 29W222]|uniref:EamA domain-containing protein n=1 Tax=Fulvivirga marina TaxID=2494733 RepID=A0A937KCC0_9BACT|nr:hypothetical protein [Fulvivirga marina]MBL6447214.1 hypothetical protein [Fulvivirga marina]